MAQAVTAKPAPKRKRRWLQFSLRTLLLTVLVSSLAFRQIQFYRNQEQLRAKLSEAGAVVYMKNHVPKWVAPLFGNAQFGSIVALVCSPDPAPVLAQLHSLTNLQDLDLSVSSVVDADLASIADLRKLDALDLSHTRVTDDGLRFLRKLTHLRWLSLRKTRITDKGLECLLHFQGLRCLYLRGTAITEDGLRHLEGLQHLEVLELRETQIADAGVKQLQHLPKLRVLMLGGTNATDSGLAHLKGMPLLRHVDLSTFWAGSQMMYVDGMPLLPSGSLHETIFGATRAERFRQLARAISHSEALDLSEPGITDLGLRHLAELGQLEFLDLSGCAITDSGLKLLYELKQLVTLRVHSTGITTDGALALEKSVQGLTIEPRPWSFRPATASRN